MLPLSFAHQRERDNSTALENASTLPGHRAREQPQRCVYRAGGRGPGTLGGLSHRGSGQEQLCAALTQRKAVGKETCALAPKPHQSHARLPDAVIAREERGSANARKEKNPAFIQDQGGGREK